MSDQTGLYPQGSTGLGTSGVNAPAAPGAPDAEGRDDLLRRARRAISAIYLACEESVAKDVASIIAGLLRLVPARPIAAPAGEPSAMRQIADLVDLRGPMGDDPARVVENVRALRESHGRMCDALQGAVRRHKLGLGGEKVDTLVIEALDRVLAGGRRS